MYPFDVSYVNYFLQRMADSIKYSPWVWEINQAGFLIHKETLICFSTSPRNGGKAVLAQLYHENQNPWEQEYRIDEFPQEVADKLYEIWNDYDKFSAEDKRKMRFYYSFQGFGPGF